MQVPKPWQPISISFYSQFLIACMNMATATYAEMISHTAGIHDKITRWLAQAKLTPGKLWQMVSPVVNINTGWLILDDSVIDKTFGPLIKLACWQYSGRTHRKTFGIGLVTLLWTNGIITIPVNFRIYHKGSDGKSKQIHAAELLIWAKGLGFTPSYVMMDKAYASDKILKLIRRFDWHFIAQLQYNRLVKTGSGRERHLYDLTFGEIGSIVCIKGVGLVRVARTDDYQNDRARYLVTSDLTIADIVDMYARHWVIEVYHRELKQCVALEDCQARRARSQRNHIFCSLFAYCGLQIHRFETRETSYRVQREILAPAVQAYLKNPFIPLEKMEKSA